MTDNRMKVLMCSDDPDTILSYGLLSDMLIDHWYKQYNISYCSLQHQIGKPIPRRNEKGEIRYVKYPGHVKGERNPTFLPEVFRITQPDIFWTNFDIQHYINVMKYVPKQPLWIGWVPWDNLDPGQIQRAQQALNKVDIRVAISKFGYDFLNQYKVRMDDWIYNMVDTQVFTPLKPDDPNIQVFKKSNPWYHDGMKMLLFVGRPNWRKRITHMFKIIEELHKRGHDFMFFFHSNMEDPAAITIGANIPELIDACGINKKIIRSRFHWDIGISKGELNVIYNLATLYFAPHGGEGFGMPIVEAMAAGTPFVASDYCTSREFAGEDGERGFLGPVRVPLDTRGMPLLDKGVVRPYPLVKEFADIIEQVWDDKKRLKKMGESGTKWAKENCSPNVIAFKWRKILDQFDIDVAEVKGYKK